VPLYLLRTQDAPPVG